MPVRLRRDDVHLWRTSMLVPPIVARDLEVLLSCDERAKAVRFRRCADRDRYLASHAMLRIVLSRYVGVPPSELEFETEQHGKPRLKLEPGLRLSFNLAHSAALALLAVSGGPAVGVDVEEIRDDVDVSLLAQAVLCSSELRVWRAAPDGTRRSLFFRSWVRKEAVLKGCGLGLAMEPDRVPVLRDGANDGGAGAIMVGLDGGRAGWGVREVEIEDRYAAAVAAPGRTWTLSCFEHRWREAGAARNHPDSRPSRPGKT